MLAKDITSNCAKGDFSTTQCQEVQLSLDLLDSFLEASAKEYWECTPEVPPSCFVVLVGSLVKGVAQLQRLEFAESVRADDPNVLEEFASNIIPCFSGAYTHKRRGYWCSPRDLLRINRQAAREGLEVLGSMHFHPDSGRLGLEQRNLTLSQSPTPMDEHMFRNGAWPVNMLCYLEGRDGVLVPTLAAWSPPPLDDLDVRCAPIPLQLLSEGGIVTGASLELPALCTSTV
ncbi:hypothetical protein [Streptomyces decoyicus]|uniref:hypothetical protein n=1 Tax=Streptomyces decoyicus TaxID=249567 RepID=UPI0033A7B70E